MSELDTNGRLLLVEHDLKALQTQQMENDRLFTHINDVIRPSIVKVAGIICMFLLSAGIPIATFLVKLGQYPDADQFMKAQAEYRATQEVMEKRVQSLELSRAEQEVRLQTIIESLKRLEQKLDTALARRQR